MEHAGATVRCGVREWDLLVARHPEVPHISAAELTLAKPELVTQDPAHLARQFFYRRDESSRAGQEWYVRVGLNLRESKRALEGTLISAMLTAGARGGELVLYGNAPATVSCGVRASDVDANLGWRVDYDRNADVLNLRMGEAQPAVSHCVDDFWLRIGLVESKLAAVEIDDFGGVFLARRPELATAWKEFESRGTPESQRRVWIELLLATIRARLYGIDPQRADATP